MQTVTFHPQERTVQVPQGTSLLEAALKAQISLNNLCGGDGICGRCRMIVKKGEVSGEISGKLTRQEIRKGYALWVEALDINWKEYLSEIEKNSLTGSWAKEVIEFIRES